VAARLTSTDRVERNVKKIGLFVEVAYQEGRTGYPQHEERKKAKMAG
jgi:hypothetical protein